MTHEPESMRPEHRDPPVWYIVLLYPLGIVLALWAWWRDR